MLTIRQVCDRLNVSRWTLIRWKKRGLLVPRQLPGSRAVRYRESDVSAFVRKLPEAK